MCTQAKIWHVLAVKVNLSIPHAQKTTRIVLGLLQSADFLDKGHHVYMDNYYTSPELFSELYYRQTYACGTVRTNRKGLPETVKKAKVKTT